MHPAAASLDLFGSEPAAQSADIGCVTLLNFGFLRASNSSSSRDGNFVRSSPHLTRTHLSSASSSALPRSGSCSSTGSPSATRYATPGGAFDGFQETPRPAGGLPRPAVRASTGH